MAAEKKITVEADSRDEARQKIKAQIPPGLAVLSENTLADGESKVLKGYGSTLKEAAEEVLKKKPPDSKVVEKRKPIEPGTKLFHVEAFDEQGARDSVGTEIGDGASIEGVTLARKGKRGFLGVGKTPHLYDVTVRKLAVVEVVVKGKARIEATIGKWRPPARAHCQVCGKKNSPQKVVDKHVHFFCSPACEEGYFEVRSGKKFLDRGTMVISIGEGGAQFSGSCWACGRSVSTKDESCPSCGRVQEVTL